MHTHKKTLNRCKLVSFVKDVSELSKGFYVRRKFQMWILSDVFNLINLIDLFLKIPDKTNVHKLLSQNIIHQDSSS